MTDSEPQSNAPHHLSVDQFTADNLPSFDNPPVIEVAISVEFRPLPTLGAANLVRLADGWQPDYPLLEELPALPPTPPAGGAPDLPTMLVSVGAPAIRLLRLTPARDRVLQVQRDRLILNWQRHDAGYPHYSQLKPPFLAAWDDLRSFVRDHGGRNPEPTLIELTFVNRLDNNGSTAVKETLAGGAISTRSLGQPAVVRFNQLWRVDPGGHEAAVQAAVDSAPPPGPILSVTYSEALSPPATDADLIAALDRGHVTAVTAFDEITTEAAHTRWGRHP